MTYTLLINNIYILEQKIKLPRDIIGYINKFIGNSFIESKNYRYTITRKGIDNKIINFSNKRKKKMDKLLEIKRAGHFTWFNKEHHVYINNLLIKCRNDLESKKNIEKILIYLKNNKWKSIKNIPKQVYYDELKKK